MQQLEMTQRATTEEVRPFCMCFNGLSDQSCHHLFANVLEEYTSACFCQYLRQGEPECFISRCAFGPQGEFLQNQLEDCQAQLQYADASDVSAHLQSKQLRLSTLQGKLHQVQVNHVASASSSFCNGVNADAFAAGSQEQQDQQLQQAGDLHNHLDRLRADRGAAQARCSCMACNCFKSLKSS